MKLILATILLISSFALAAPAPFGAFTYRNYLYVTYMGDCNTIDATLEVKPLCHKDRVTRNLAVTCATELHVASTRMICPEVVVPPKVFIFDLANQPIAPEAREIVINHNGNAVRVKVNRQ